MAKGTDGKGKKSLPMSKTGKASFTGSGKQTTKTGNFKKIASSAGKKYGSAEAGKRVAGAILAKLRAKRSAAARAKGK